MPAYSGKFQYTGEHGEVINQGPCQVSFDAETCVVTPTGSTPLAFDLGDVDRTTPGEWDLQLALYTGRTVTLKQFGAAFSNMAGELIAAWRDRTVQCLLLEDLEEVGRYSGTANGGPGEVRIFKSNLAFLPQAGLPVQWRLAEVESIAFDDAAYGIVLTRGKDRLVLSKLAKKTDEVFGKLQEAHAALREHSATALHSTFPFLSADQLVRLQLLMPEGRSASLTEVNRIHPKLMDSLIARAVTAPLRPYFDALRARAASEPLFAGFKFIRPDEEEKEETTAEETTQASGDEEPQPLFFWFFFPLPNKMVAWEATTGSGRATYFFRGTSAEIDSLTRGLALVNFRREPVYLPDDSLDSQPRYHRYAIGARKLPDLRTLRAAYAGRAIHSTIEAWQSQVQALVGGA
jgi:hypothetical protein